MQLQAFIMYVLQSNVDPFQNSPLEHAGIRHDISRTLDAVFRDQTDTVISEMRFLRAVFHKRFVLFFICRSLGGLTKEFENL